MLWLGFVLRFLSTYEAVIFPVSSSRQSLDKTFIGSSAVWEDLSAFECMVISAEADALSIFALKRNHHQIRAHIKHSAHITGAGRRALELIEAEQGCPYIRVPHLGGRFFFSSRIERIHFFYAFLRRHMLATLSKTSQSSFVGIFRQNVCSHVRILGKPHLYSKSCKPLLLGAFETWENRWMWNLKSAHELAITKQKRCRAGMDQRDYSRLTR